MLDALFISIVNDIHCKGNHTFWQKKIWFGTTHSDNLHAHQKTSGVSCDASVPIAEKNKSTYQLSAESFQR